MAALFSIMYSHGQEQGKGDKRDVRMIREGARLGGEKAGGGMLGGDGGAQEAFLARIINNPKLAAELELSDEQINILKTSQEAMKNQNEQLQNLIKESGMEQAKLLTSDSIDENALMAAVEKTGNVRTEMAKARMRHMLVVKKTLKPDQAKKLKALVQKQVKQARGNIDGNKEQRENTKKQNQEIKKGF